MPSFSFTVPADFSKKERLDKYISSVSGDMNRSKLKSGLSSLMLNGKSAKLSSKVSAGDLIVVEWEDAVPSDILPENIPLDVVYEDENVTVVNKKCGMVTHPASGNWGGTLVNALLFRWGREKIPNSDEVTVENLAKFRPGIVHRLDKDTSGVIITARNRKSEEWLHNQFLDHRLLQKEYIAICVGRPREMSGRIETQIVRDPHDRKAFKAVTDTDAGKFACTIYQCVGIYEYGKETYSLFRLRIKTGRTHQIRVHLKHIGCPILGDSVYCKKSEGMFKNAQLMLHAYVLRIRLPDAKVLSEFKASVPVRFRKVMKVLHSKFRKVK